MSMTFSHIRVLSADSSMLSYDTETIEFSEKGRTIKAVI